MDTLKDIFEQNGDKYRAMMRDLDGYDAASQDDVIKIFLTISQVFVDNSFGLGAVDLAIKARDKLTSQFSSQDSMSCVSVPDLDIIEHVHQPAPYGPAGEPDSKVKTKTQRQKFEEQTP